MDHQQGEAQQLYDNQLHPPDPKRRRLNAASTSVTTLGVTIKSYVSKSRGITLHYIDTPSSDTKQLLDVSQLHKSPPNLVVIGKVEFRRDKPWRITLHTM